MVGSPGFQEAGHTSPCLSTNWKAWTSLTKIKIKNIMMYIKKNFLILKPQIFSHILPTGKSLMLI